MMYLDSYAVTQLRVEQSFRVITISQILTLTQWVTVSHVLSTGTSAKGKCEADKHGYGGF